MLPRSRTKTAAGIPNGSKMIAPRLCMLWQLWNDDNGVIFVSINDVELFGLGMLLNEISGEENWIGTLIW